MEAHPKTRTTCGFTLIEISVVLFLIALLASVVAISSGGMIRGATLEEVVAQIESLDVEARRNANRLGHAVELKIDSESRKLTLADPRNPEGPQLGGMYLPRTLELTQVWQMVGDEPDNATDVVIRYEPDGSATTWGLTISNPIQNEGLATIVIAGMTGQATTHWENDEQAKSILAEAFGRHTD